MTFNRRQNVGLHHVALKPPTAPRLTNLNADDFHLQGMAKLHRGTRDSVDEALTQFGQAIQRSGFRHGARNGSVVPFLAQGERVDE